MIYLLFLLSGISGLIYQVVWVREFGNVFGNTIHSASLVVAVFMLGLGAGSYLVGSWADRRYQAAPDSLLKAYGYVELAIAALGLIVAASLPHLGTISAFVSSYSQEPSGWYALSTASYFARGAAAVVLLTPITLLMGGTLTLLVRHLVRHDLELGGWRIALLYAVNTAGAAIGCALTDFILVPAYGLFDTQLVAVFFNVLAGVGALLLALRVAPRPVEKKPSKGRRRASAAGMAVPTRIQVTAASRDSAAVGWTGLALFLSGIAAMGMEILWFRHFTILLGGFRAVFSLLLTVILVGIGVGSLAGGVACRRTGKPAVWFMVTQALFVVTTLYGFSMADVHAIDEMVRSIAPGPETLGAGGSAAGSWVELWFNARPMLVEVGLPALLMGFSFPLGNAVVQHAERLVGSRAGMLYLANTAGALCGSLVAGFVLLPTLGLQLSATVLTTVALVAAVPLYLAIRAQSTSAVEPRAPSPESRVAVLGLGLTLAAGAAALLLWVRLPSDYVMVRALGTPEDERVLTISEGLTEVIAVTEQRGQGLTLTTNGHAMSSTLPLAQRYMRALAHVPLLSMQDPRTVLVIGFGVGNSTHAATLHPSVERVDLADLSRSILAHADYFREGNRGVLSSPRLRVHINDGRQHLLMQPEGSYDLITLEPPPIAYAGVSALYSREFYALAKSRLKADGYVSQWLPAYQVPVSTTLAMIRAFVDVFPQSVLLSGAESDLILLGTNGSRIEIDPDHVAAALARAPEVQADLDRIGLGRVREIVGSFVGSSRTLAEATISAEPVTDDRPVQEYDVRSLLNFSRVVPGSVMALERLGEWCPRCYANGAPTPVVSGLDTYMSLLGIAYSAAPADVALARALAEQTPRVLVDSAYLGMIVPESAATHNTLGIGWAAQGRIDEAMAEFMKALALDPDDASTHWHLGAGFASLNRRQEALEHLQRSAQLNPGNGLVQQDLGVLLADAGRWDEAADHLENALQLDPTSDELRRNLAAVREQLARSRTNGGSRP
ncbi:MAG: tetratricopeptide repeat protein [Acidobacteria bacterium]|nr:tetratricopeptide repeat protein [Acidobacteriota bacterium]